MVSYGGEWSAAAGLLRARVVLEIRSGERPEERVLVRLAVEQQLGARFIGRRLLVSRECSGGFRES